MKPLLTYDSGMPGNDLGQPKKPLALQLAQNSRKSTPTDPDLQRLMTAWPALPAPIKQAVLTLLDAAGKGRE